MNRRTIVIAAPVALIVLCASSAVGAENPTPETKLRLERSEEPNRFGLSYRAGFNISANFKNVGVFPAVVPGPPMAGVPHNYQDGYVRVDESSNAGGETMNWGYLHSSQVQGNSIVMSASNPGNLSDTVDGKPQHGFELTYRRELARASRCPWGFEAAFGFTALNFGDSATMMGGPLTVDAYGIPPGAPPPPVAPHYGFPDQPGPTLYDSPTRLPVTVASSLDGSMYGFRLGPYLEIPLGERVAFALSGGFAMAVVAADFSFQQSYRSPASGMVSQAHTGSHSEVLPGGYLAGNFSCRLGKSWLVFAGAQYQNTGIYEYSLADKSAAIDLRQCVFVTAGVGWDF